MKGTDIMIIGSFILIFIVFLVPREDLLVVAIPFIMVELVIAFYFIIRNNKKHLEV